MQHRVRRERADRSKFSRFYPSEWPRVRTYAEQLGTTKVAIRSVMKDDVDNRGAREERDSFGPPWDPAKYEWARDEDGAFGGGGYFFVFSPDRDLSRLMLDELERDRWIDKQTRRVMCVVPYYNGNYRLFALARLVVELDAGGSLESRLEMRSARLELYRTPFDVLRVCLELLFLVSLVVQTVCLVRAARGQGLASYFKAGLNLIDVVRMIVSYICIGLYVRTLTHELRADQKEALEQPDGPRFGKTVNPSRTFMDLPGLVQREDDYYLATAINILLTVAVLFKYLVPFPQVRILVESVTASFRELTIFLILILVVVAGYTVLGLVLFGHVVEDFKSLPDSFFAVARFAFDEGAGAYKDLVAAAGVISTSLYYWSFLIVVTVLFLNIALAIVLQAYESVKRKTSHLRQLRSEHRLSLAGVFLRHIILGREPSVFERTLPLSHLCRRRFDRASNLFKRKDSLGLVDRSFGDDGEDDIESESEQRGTPRVVQLVGRHISRAGSILAPRVQRLGLTFEIFSESHLRNLLQPRRAPFDYLLSKILSVAAVNTSLLAHDLDELEASAWDTADDGFFNRYNDNIHTYDVAALLELPLVLRCFKRVLHLVVRDHRCPYDIAPRDVDAIARELFERHAEDVPPKPSEITFRHATTGAMNHIGSAARYSQLKLDAIDARCQADAAALNAKLDRILAALAAPPPPPLDSFSLHHAQQNRND